MPEARTTEQHEAVQQTVRDLLQGVHDPQRAAHLIADVVAHHAPELQEWARAQLRAKHPSIRLRLENPTPKPPEAAFQAIFGVRPVTVPEPLPKPSKAVSGTPASTFRVDPELGRLCVALHLAPALRLWIVIRQYVRDHEGSGWIERGQLRQILQEQRVALSDRHLRRVLARGEGIFWNVTRQRVYMRSWTYLAVTLTEMALNTHVAQADRNRLGAREMYVPVGGSVAAWEAQLYAAWLAYRNNPTISRDQLGSLFGRDKTVLRRWEKEPLAGQLTVRHNFAQCPSHEAFYAHIPSYATSYVAWVRWQGRPRKVARIRWQLPNTYQAGAIRQHHRKGQSAKVRRRVNRVTETKPADERRGGWHRLYFDQPETLRRFVRKHPEAEARYVWRGENRYQQGIFEINASGFPLTHCLERVQPKEERRFLQAAAGSV